MITEENKRTQVVTKKAGKERKKDRKDKRKRRSKNVVTK